MTENATTRLLLTHLVQFSAFSQQGEVLCTRGLEHLLQNAQAQGAFARLLQSLIAQGSTYVVPDSLTWLAEVLQRDGNRPDLEAIGPDGKPKIKVEAKLRALLQESQLQSYAADLQTRAGGGLLVVLVPKWRLADAQQIAVRAFPEQRSCEIVLVSWESVLNALVDVKSEPLAGDLAQFSAMYYGLTGMPITQDELGLAWRKDPGNFIKLVDLATRQMSAPGPVMPFGIEDEDGPECYHRRYVCRKLGDTVSWFSVGVRDPFQGYRTPLWLRFHRTGPMFHVARDRIASSPLAERVLPSGGHVWLPIEVPIGAPAEATVSAIVEQAEEIAQIVYGLKTDALVAESQLGEV